MTSQRLAREEYLSKDFDYTKLTKQELRAIMSENGIEDIPPLTALKSAIIDAYKKSIHDRIDTIKSNFSEENVFQGQKRKPRLEGSVSSTGLDTEDRKDQSRHLGEGGSFNSEHSNVRDSSKPDGSFARKGQMEDSSEINSTAFNRKSKIPFIAIPRRREAEGNAAQGPAAHQSSAMDHGGTMGHRVVVKIPRDRGRRIFTLKRVLLTIFVGLCAYFKFCCPYCKPGLRFCIPVPPHSRLVNDQLVCDQGYRVSKGIVDVCVPDVEGEGAVLRKAESYIKMLEYLKGDYKFGYAKSPKMKVSVISDPMVLRTLQHSPKVQFSEDTIEAKITKVSFRVLIRFYSMFLFKVCLMIAVLLCALKILINRRKRATMLRARAVSISKEILDILNRQIMMSVKSTQFKPYVLAQQMRDALDVKEELWQYVSEIIQKNSNVEKATDDQNRVMWKWVGPVLYKTETIDIE